MQKLPKASDRKIGDAFTKKGTVPTKEIIFGHIYSHLHCVIPPFHWYSGRISSPTEWLLNPEIKAKYKKISTKIAHEMS